MLLKALDVASDRVFGHPPGLCQRAVVRNAAGQGGHDSGESAFWFGTKRDFVVVVLSHRIGPERDLASAPYLYHAATPSSLPAFGGPVAT